MIKIGEFNTLEILRITSVGLFLGDDSSDVLLPNKYIPNDFKVGDKLDVFVYLDHQERITATTLKPYISLNDFGWLRVNYINKYGAFLDWGLEKDLFVPFKEQARPMEVGKRYLVYMYIDTETNRLVASSKINQFLDNSDLTVTEGDQVDLIISHITELGINVIINKKHKGLIYKDSLFQDLKPGQITKGYVKTIRPDGKIDVTLQKIGLESIDENAETILKELRASRGFLRLTDDSHPEDIKTVLKMSKKSFKKAVGSLYKAKLIELKEDGIYLL